MIKIYNNLTKKLETINKNTISLYVCGPTVYNSPHIGNIRPLVIFDVFYRLLVHNNIKVTYIHNITDVDDKIINKAIENKVSEADIAKKYFDEYMQLVNDLNANNFSYIPKVTENINGIIDYINCILNTNKFAYVKNNNVYFCINEFKNYGIVSNQNKTQLLNNSETDYDLNKKDKLDFALWKQTKIGITWQSPWGFGRPGWHTECAYFINKYCNNGYVDIHGGGVDLKFPHHENENAQNYAINNKNIANLWIHTGHINFNKEKMSKSLGNVILAKNLIATKGPKTLRWLMYQTGYSKPLDYSETIIEQCNQDIKKIFLSVNQGMQFLALNDQKNDNNIFDNEFINLLENNLDFSNAITRLFVIVNLVNQNIRNKNINDTKCWLSKLLTSLEILGLWNKDIKYSVEDIDLIKKHDSLIKAKDFINADIIRKKIKKFL